LLVIMALSASLAIGLFATGCGGGGNKADAPAVSTPAASQDTPADSTPAASKDETPNPPKSKPDTDAFAEIAVKACVDSAAREGVPEDMASEYCNCAIDELLQNLDSSQIADIALSGDTDLPPDVEEELMNAVLDCIDKLMQ
jgi:hypothetical protein